RVARGAAATTTTATAAGLRATTGRLRPGQSVAVGADGGSHRDALSRRDRDRLRRRSRAPAVRDLRRLAANRPTGDHRRRRTVVERDRRRALTQRRAVLTRLRRAAVVGIGD